MKKHKSCAFTLAEVLITLGIIGVVAAMTLPVLIQKHNNRVVETRLKKFYSAINQAVLLAESEYGDKKIWWQSINDTADKDEDGNFIAGSNETENWFIKYLEPHIKIIKHETLSNGAFRVYFEDGSALENTSIHIRDWIFYPGNIAKCDALGYYNKLGVCAFHFNFCPNYEELEPGKWKYHENKGFEPYKYAWDGDRNTLLNGCKLHKNELGYQYCTALIQYDGWKITDDYPWKVKY